MSSVSQFFFSPTSLMTNLLAANPTTRCRGYDMTIALAGLIVDRIKTSEMCAAAYRLPETGRLLCFVA